MLYIIIVMLTGIVVGLMVAKRDESGKIACVFARIQQFATVALLFTMGLWLGTNDAFWHDITTIGLQGLVIAAFSVGFSVLFVFLFSRVLISKGRRE